MVTTHVPDPEQSPRQPLKLAVRIAWALSVTTVPLGKEAFAAAQRSPQLIPAGALVTLPRMDPTGVLVMLKVKLRRSNRAATLLAASMVTVQAPVPAQAPDHPAKSDPGSGCAFKETSVPWAKAAEQVLPQSMPAGLLLTTPEPAPCRETASGKVEGGAAATETAVEQVTRSGPLMTWTAGA
jgi:hypothetical protein